MPGLVRLTPSAGLAATLKNAHVRFARPSGRQGRSIATEGRVEPVVSGRCSMNIQSLSARDHLSQDPTHLLEDVRVALGRA